MIQALIPQRGKAVSTCGGHPMRNCSNTSARKTIAIPTSCLASKVPSILTIARSCRRVRHMTTLLFVLLLVQQNAPDLDTVITRATDYVSRYEAELGNLIGAEEYVQTSVWLDNSNPPRVAKR